VVHSDVIRAVINNEAKIPPTKKEKEIKGLPVTDPEIVKVEPLGHDRDKNRIWSFDGMSILLPSLVTNGKTLHVYTNPATLSSAHVPLCPSRRLEPNLNP
jgi:hypothetical protein